MKTKVCLINPPAPWADEPAMNPPLGLAYISSYIKKHCDAEVTALDLCQHNLTMFDIPPDANVYGINCMTPQFPYVVEIVKHIYKLNPSADFVFGGPHFTSMPEDAVELGGVVIRGQGEKVFADFLNGSYVSCDDVHRIDDLDSLPFPDRDAFGMGNYHRTLNGKPAAHIITLRGCPFNCSFCDRLSVGRDVKYRSIENVMEEIDHLRLEYDINSLIIYDDIFTLDKKRVHAFCKEFKKRGTQWRCWSRADTLDKELLIEMKRSGLTSLTMGIESGDDEILKMVDKKITSEKNRQALLWCKELEIPVRCSLMFGNPGECERSIQNTIKLIEETQPDEWNLAVLTPIPGSPIWDNPDKYGIKLDKEKLRHNQYRGLDRFNESGIGNIGYEFTHMSQEETSTLLRRFVKGLEAVCPRTEIQDTIQNINLDGVEVTA